MRGRHAEHARERHGRTRDCRSPPQNAVCRFTGAFPAQARQGPDEAGAARAAGRRRRKCAVRSTPPITTLPSPNSALAWPGGWFSGTNISPPPPMLPDEVLHDGVAADKPVLVAQPLEHPLGGLALLSVLAEIIPQPLLDDLGEPVQLRPPDRCGSPASRRHREAQHLLRALARDPEKTRRLTLAHAVPTGQTDLPIKLHGENTPPSPQPERAKVADFYAARCEPVPPLPWSTLAPPFPVQMPWVTPATAFGVHGTAYGVSSGQLVGVFTITRCETAQKHRTAPKSFPGRPERGRDAQAGHLSLGPGAFGPCDPSRFSSDEDVLGALAELLIVGDHPSAERRLPAKPAASLAGKIGRRV